MYETRPIHWPFSSAKKTFVAWISIHRWNAQTLRILLGDHLQVALTRLEGELSQLTAARGAADKKEARATEQRTPTEATAGTSSIARLSYKIISSKRWRLSRRKFSAVGGNRNCHKWRSG